MQDHFFTIDKETSAEVKDRGSRFIGLAIPIASTDDFKKHLALIKKAHPKATHHCFAYRLQADRSVFRVNDDGEPSGSAGKPILGQIDSRNLTNALVVVVRYFGGTLLGVPGLIQAYRMAAAACLDGNTFIRKNVEIAYLLEFDYTRINEIMQVIKKHIVTITEKETGIFCKFRIGIPVKEEGEVRRSLLEIPGTSLSLVA
jgi:uncharacterized YigZ family protein